VISYVKRYGVRTEPSIGTSSPVMSMHSTGSIEAILLWSTLASIFDMLCISERTLSGSVGDSDPVIFGREA
jgi:hypothetical protein